MSNDERVVICKNRRPIAISRPRADVCQLACQVAKERREEKRLRVAVPRVVRQRVSANGKAASLSTARFVARHPERTREAGGRERACIVSNRIARSRFAPLMRTNHMIALLSPAEKGRAIEKAITGLAGFARVSTKTAAGWLVSFFPWLH